MSYASTLLIEELSSAGDAKRRSVLLLGPSLPFMGANWATGQQLVTTWYPGNRQASQQVLGPREMPSSWSGVWRRTLMGKAPAKVVSDGGEETLVNEPFALYTFLDGMHLGGRLLRVTWSVTGDSSDQRGKIVREGRIKSFEINPERIQDIPWKLDLEWSGRGARVRRVTRTRDDGLDAATTALNSAMLLAISGADAASFRRTPNVVGGATNVTLGQLEALAAAPNNLLLGVTKKLRRQVLQVKAVADLARKTATLPDQLASTAVDFARDTVAIANQYVDDTGRTPFELTSTKTKVADLVRSYTYFAQQTDAIGAVADRARELDEKIRPLRLTRPGAARLDPTRERQRPNDVVGVYKTRAGDTPAKVSVRLWKTPDHDVDLLEANRMAPHTATFDPGIVLLVPSLRNARRAG